MVLPGDEAGRGRDEEQRHLGHILGPPDASGARTGTHPVWDGAAYRDVATYDRARLAPGMVVEGPAVVEQYDATTVVLPGHRAVVDPWLNLLIRPAEAGA